MDNQLKHNMCLLCGDIHGCLRRDKWGHIGFFDIVDRCGGFENTDIILLGDIGIGFHTNSNGIWSEKPDMGFLKELNKWAKDNNNDVWVFRGNHDDPTFFKRDCKIWDLYDNLHLLEDGDIVISHNGKKYLVVGGSVSIDRSERTLGMSYWDDEYLNIDVYKKLPEQKVDGVLAHTGPTPPRCRKSDFLNQWHDHEEHYFESYGYCNNHDRSLLEVIDEEKKNIDIIIDKFKPTRWFNGHFHDDAKFEHKGVEVIALDVCRFLELDRYE